MITGIKKYVKKIYDLFVYYGSFIIKVIGKYTKRIYLRSIFYAGLIAKAVGKHIKEKYVRYVFYISIGIKGIDSILEIIGGLILLLITPNQLTAIVRFVMQVEITEDPKDIIVHYLINLTHHLSVGLEFFIAIYLLIHGLVKIAIVIGLLKNKLWSYPVGVIVFSLFVIYQIYQFTSSHSVGLIILTIFDIFVISLIWHEYKYRKKSKRFN